jgi:hypothetical protein
MKVDDKYRANLVPRQCTNCEVEFPSRPDRPGLQCSASCRTAARNRLVGTGLPAIEVARRNKRLKNYGLSHEDYLSLWEKQNGACAICRMDLVHGGRQLNSCHVDHDHKTGVVRGLLCPSCNHGLGKFRDNSELLRSAAVYLSPN